MNDTYLKRENVQCDSNNPLSLDGLGRGCDSRVFGSFPLSPTPLPHGGEGLESVVGKRNSGAA